MLAAHVASALRRTARIAVERPRAALWTLLALTAALFAAGVAGLAALHVEEWTRAPQLDPAGRSESAPLHSRQP